MKNTLVRGFSFRAFFSELWEVEGWGGGGWGGGSKRHRIPHGATGKDSIQLSTTILFSEY